MESAWKHARLSTNDLLNFSPYFFSSYSYRRCFFFLFRALKISYRQHLRSFHGTVPLLPHCYLNSSPSACSIFFFFFTFMKMVFGSSYSGFLLLCFKDGSFVFVLDKQHFVHFFISHSAPDESIDRNTFVILFPFMVDYNQNSYQSNCTSLEGFGFC